jgi:hypothetical protein
MKRKRTEESERIMKNMNKTEDLIRQCLKVYPNFFLFLSLSSSFMGDNIKDVEDTEAERERLVERYTKTMKDIFRRFDVAKRESEELEEQEKLEVQTEVEQFKLQVNEKNRPPQTDSWYLDCWSLKSNGNQNKINQNQFDGIKVATNDERDDVDGGDNLWIALALLAD